MKPFRIVLIPFVFFATPLLADSLDGDWCAPDGSHLRIDGPSIELAPGVTVMGKYGRHTFSYIAPPGDFEAGAEVQFVQRSHEEMRRVRNPQAMPEHADIWRRCETISFVPARANSIRRSLKG